jgi:hypothetical protein
MHNIWIMYTGGYHSSEGEIGAGWCYGYSQDGKIIPNNEGWCHLGERMEVYDAEIHAVAKGLKAIGAIVDFQ